MGAMALPPQHSLSAFLSRHSFSGMQPPHKKQLRALAAPVPNHLKDTWKLSSGVTQPYQTVSRRSSRIGISQSAEDLSQIDGLNPSASKGCVGLHNLGNTCFFNSILQCLAAVPALVAFCRQRRLDAAISASSPRLAAEYAILARRIWESPAGTVISPTRLLDEAAIWDRRWGDGRQHDAQEFLHSLLEGLQAELNKNKVKPPYKELSGKGSVAEQAEEAWAYTRACNSSIIDDIFGGQLQSTIQCSNCQACSHCFEYFLDLSLPIPKQRSSVTVQDCLHAFTEIEELDEDEGYRCPTCKKVGPAKKQLSIYRQPQDTTPVKPCLSLDLTEYSSHRRSPHSSKFDQDSYSLIAISNHAGSLGGGHYTAMCKAISDQRWYTLNDTAVRRAAAPSSSLASESAYVLLYEKSDIKTSLL
ncbi:hypothetical protein WJX84_009291 [Apatococcus fuscideae]|uniref:Ubiquitin carboxyl-terminal hydrolase n=1 Tax=Apatococcus fuscideae TaxID=2026836 RepID=A0AAW1SYA8_9CHLO